MKHFTGGTKCRKRMRWVKGVDINNFENSWSVRPTAKDRSWSPRDRWSRQKPVWILGQSLYQRGHRGGIQHTKRCPASPSEREMHTPTHSRMAKMNVTLHAEAGKTQSKRKICMLLLGMQNNITTLENRLTGYFMKVNIDLFTMWPRTPPLWYLPKENETLCSHKNAYASIASGSYNWPKSETSWTSFTAWRDKLWSIHTPECYSAWKRMEFFIRLHFN